MKWFENGKVLFSKLKFLSVKKSIILFPITLIMFVGIFLCFILFGLSYAITFCLENVGISNNSNINENDDKYIKISKIIFSVLLYPIIFLGNLILIVLFFPMGIFSLWVDALSFIICQGEGASFNISKQLLSSNK